MPRRTKKRCSPATETVRPISARPTRSSSSEMSLRASQRARMSAARSSTRRERMSPPCSLGAKSPVSRRCACQRIAVDGAPCRRRAATHPAIHRRQKPRTQIYRKRLSHPCWPPLPAWILNQKSRRMGILLRFKTVEFRSKRPSLRQPHRLTASISSNRARHSHSRSLPSGPGQLGLSRA